MDKIVAVLGVCMVLSGCANLEKREARCKCFKADGTSTGNCEFTRLPDDPAVFSFVASRSINNPLQISSKSLEPAMQCRYAQ